jgi:signal transduction histidine kinase
VRIGASLGVSILAAVGLTVAAMIALAAASGTVVLPVDATLPILVALALLCVVGLTLRDHPTAAWLSTVGAAAIATAELAAIARASRQQVDDSTWRWMAMAVCLGAIFSTGIAAAYASDPRRRLGPWVPAVGFAVVAVAFGAAAVALADPAGGTFIDSVETDIGLIGTLNLVTRVFLLGTIGLVVLGLVGDARPAGRRASRRVATLHPAPTGWVERLRYGEVWARLFIEEISPGRSRARRAALTERARLARDLHAEVVPAIRRAIAAAEQDGSPEHLATSLRAVLREVDALGRSEHAIQLEVGGILPALEWLAERTEDRSTIRVDIEVEQDGADGGQPPRDVCASAFRVATLALDNAARHAPGAHVRVTADIAPDRLTLAIADDGPGIAAGATQQAIADGRRGLADMQEEALACGALLVVGGADRGVGTSVRFTWPG